MKKKKYDKKSYEVSREKLFSNTFFVLKYLFKTNKMLYVARFLNMAIQTAMTFIPIIFTRNILNAITEHSDMKEAFFWVIVMAITSFLANILSNVFGTFDQKQIAKTRYLANLALGKSVSKIRYEDLEHPDTKSFVGLAQEDSMIYILVLVCNFISSVIKLLGLSAIVLSFEPLIIILIAAVVTVKMIIDKKKHRRLEFYRSVWAPVNRKTNYILDLMREPKYAKEVRVNDLTDWLCKKHKKHFDEEEYPLYKSREMYDVKLNAFTFVTGIAQECIVYIILAFRVVFSGMSIGNFSMYMTGINSFSDSVSGAFWNYFRLIIMSRFAREFRYCIELEKNIKKENEICREGYEEWKEVTVEFRNVSFKYPGTDILVINNLSIIINPGETLSIVGLNGAGKTTFVKLLCRLYEPTEGTIFINKVPVNKIPLDKYYELLGVVFQDFKLFSFSARENITLNTKWDTEKLKDSIERSGLTNKIRTLENGIETSVSKDFDDYGVEFSGGEGQKLAIARTLYKDTPIIILDEPTSALDPIAEYEIYNRFHQLTEGKSTIYISHRLSSTRFTDRIAVFSDGTIIECGNHTELMQIDNGIYKNMFEMQAQYYVE